MHTYLKNLKFKYLIYIGIIIGIPNWNMGKKNNFFKSIYISIFMFKFKYV